MNMAKRIHREEGFTLIELMIVILIIGILVGIAVPVFLAAQSNAKSKSCQSNQRNFLSAADIFASELERYPLAADVGGAAGWPASFYEGDLDAQSEPACPSAPDGDVTVTYGATSEERPTTACSIAEHNS